jgi:hypothetical protein
MVVNNDDMFVVPLPAMDGTMIPSRRLGGRVKRRVSIGANLDLNNSGHSAGSGSSLGGLSNTSTHSAAGLGEPRKPRSSSGLGDPRKPLSSSGLGEPRKPRSSSGLGEPQRKPRSMKQASFRWLTGGGQTPEELQAEALAEALAVRRRLESKLSLSDLEEFTFAADESWLEFCEGLTLVEIK